MTAGRPTTCPLDPIPSSLLQTISGDLLPYLTSLINSSLTAGYVPSVFKRARVAPLLKKPTLDPSDVNNYRPVSLLSFLSKTLERAVLGQLSRYLSQNDLLDPNQSGFKTSHSTETALLCITEALRTAKANSLSSALILLDLSAAFDTVNHQILLSTLSELGISGAAHAWIASYLTGRSSPPSSLSADDFVNHFEKKVDDIRSSFAKSNDTAGSAHTALPCALTSFSPLSPDEISRLVTAGRPTTCPLDPIPSSLLQTISGDLLPYLTSLINSSLTAGYVPSVFKRARVAPLLKKPTLDPSDVNNYRPVSLLSFLSKTLERAVLGQLSRYLSQNDLLDPNQSGFKTSHSTETALLCITEALRTAKANSLSSALILLDLSAAFDTVNHQILLSTLSELGISGAAHAWIASYLTGRSYQVAWRESVSSPRALTTGVPQGSVLGPLLFSLYTKSLGSVITSHGLSYHCYADDTQLIFSFPPSDDQVANRISACLADISVWMTDHHLKLNLGKTELLFLPGKDCPFHDLAITVDNSIVSSSQSAKNLGVILDNTLSFSTNIKAVARSCRFMLYNIRRVRPCLTQEAAQVLIQALVISRLDYCNSLLAGLPACAIKPLQLIQNAAARLVFNLPKFSHVTPLLRSLHWLPVEARIRYKTMVLAYGAVRGTAPQYLQALIRPYTQTRALRSSTSGLLASLPLRKYSSRSAQSKLFAALAPQWWNKLPHDARTAESITTFRRHLKPHLFKEYLG